MKRMNLKLIVSLFAIGAIASSCTKDVSTDLGAEVKKEASIAVKLSDNGQSNYAIGEDNVGAVASQIDDATVFFLDNAGNVVEKFVVGKTGTLPTVAELSAGFTFRQLSSTIVKVFIVSNTQGNDLSLLSNETAIKSYAFAVEAQQSKAGKKGVAHVTMMSTDRDNNGAVVNANDPKDPTLRNSSVEIAPIVARVEVGNLAAGKGITSINVDKVYLNNFYEDFAKNAITRYTSSNWNTFASYMTDELPFASDNADKVAAYQIFPAFTADAGLLPNVVFAVSGRYTNGKSFSGYVTINKYKNGGQALTQMLPATVYNLGKNIVVSDYNISNDPDKPNENQNIEVEVTIVPWTVVDIEPEL